jgi:hypothetical protein
MTEPQEIDDEEHEQVLERVAAIDVAKASGMVRPSPAPVLAGSCGASRRMLASGLAASSIRKVHAILSSAMPASRGGDRARHSLGCSRPRATRRLCVL